MPDTPKPTVGVRQLRHDTAAILARVRRGEVLDITMRGTPIARLLPLEPPTKSSVLDELIASGRLRPAERPGHRPAMRAGDGTNRLGDALAGLRDEQTW